MGEDLRRGIFHEDPCLFLVEGHPRSGAAQTSTRVEIRAPESAREPRFWAEHQPALAVALRLGSIEIGLHRSNMNRFTYSTGEMRLSPHHLEK